MIIVGSTALKYYGILDTVQDLDVWYGPDEVQTELKVDSSVLPTSILELVPTENGYATPEAILTIKMSHLPWDIKWEKTKRHILLLKHLGYSYLPDLYLTLKSHWESVHGDKSFLSLGKNKSEFFNDFVEYKYDHDYLHELVSFPLEPCYNKCLKDNEDVLIDKDKFFSMDFSDQVRMFREEIAVIAVERWLVHGKESWYSAYGLALKKTITNLTKNWATDFIIENLDKFTKPDYSYFEHILKTLEIEMKVDMKPFEELLLALGVPSEKIDLNDIDEYIYSLSEGDSFSVSDYMDRLEIEHDYTELDGLLKENGYEHLEREGGGEGGAEYCYGVFRLKDKIYKAEHSYYSSDGHEIDGITETLKEVKPVERMVTFYE